ncbi:MAG: phosphoribosyltransferase [Candidatus Marinarcus sp.]|uniref:phosphoribosyltransferase n=1 Tax=Candidatus Marinarcus sp. TaxID=3100987 RepID=UPI003AFFADCB
MKLNKKYFKNREDAVLKLIDVLPSDTMKFEDWIVIATSAGSVPIAFELSKILKASFDYMFSHKIEAPNNPECEVAIVTESEEVVIHEELVKAFDISLDFIFAKAKNVYENEVLKYIQKYRKGERLSDLHNKNVLLVDEGLNTSLTMMACIKTAINLKAKSVSVAVPILPTVSAPIIESIADDLYYVKKLDHFVSIDFYYEELEDITFEKIEKIIKG